MIDKRALLDALRATLKEELDTQTRRAREAAEAATHEENRPENDKDMRSTEASYVAKGSRLRSPQDAPVAWRASSRALRPRRRHQATASWLEVGEQERTVFVLPAGGGVGLDVPGDGVACLATTSPSAGPARLDGGRRAGTAPGRARPILSVT